MQTITSNNHTITVYSSPKELPIARYKAMNQMILHDSGIGNDMAAVDKRLQNLYNFLSSSKIDDAVTEVNNLRFTFYSLISQLDYKSKTFACLVKEIDDVEYNDITDEGLAKVSALISEIGFTVEDLEEHFNSVKKKLIPN